METQAKEQVKEMQVAIVAADGVDESSLFKMKSALEEKGLQTKIVSIQDRIINSSQGKQIQVDEILLDNVNLDFDAVYVPGGEDSIFTLQGESCVIRFINDAYKNSKPIAVEAEGEELLYVTEAGTALNNNGNSTGLLINRAYKEFVKAIGQYNFWLTEKQLISA